MAVVAARPAKEATERRMGLPQLTALVLGSIIGVGIFSLPYSLASYGPIGLVAIAVANVGTLALALLFAALTRRTPASAGNAAIAVGWVCYVTPEPVPAFNSSTKESGTWHSR